jgi:hypothetical protein
MNVKILVVAGLLGAVITTSDAFAWSSHRSGGSGGGDTTSSVAAFSGGGSEAGYTGAVSVPEPSSLYAIGSALALIGAAGWTLRRK